MGNLTSFEKNCSYLGWELLALSEMRIHSVDCKLSCRVIWLDYFFGEPYVLASWFFSFDLWLGNFCFLWAGNWRPICQDSGSWAEEDKGGLSIWILNTSWILSFFWLPLGLWSSWARIQISAAVAAQAAATPDPLTHCARPQGSNLCPGAAETLQHSRNSLQHSRNSYSQFLTLALFWKPSPMLRKLGIWTLYSPEFFDGRFPVLILPEQFQRQREKPPLLWHMSHGRCEIFLSASECPSGIQSHLSHGEAGILCAVSCDACASWFPELEWFLCPWLSQLFPGCYKPLIPCNKSLPACNT